MTALHDLTALEQGAAVRAGEVTPTGLARHHLDRIAVIDPHLRAFVTVTEDLAMASAVEAEDQLAAGVEVGPLHGVPVAIKDVARIDGVPCTFGSTIPREESDLDDHVVARMRASGLVILGTTNTPEFALPCHTENEVVGATRNPWSADHSPGGSSGGSAAAVAAGLVPLAHGTDAAGSVRIPAAACGVVGFKPSRGRVSNGPVDHDVSGLSEHGALARTVDDAIALVAAMSGPRPGDTATAPDPIGPPGRPLRVVALPAPMVPDVVPTEACLAAAQLAADRLAAAGHEVDTIEVGPDQAVADAFRLVRAVHAASLPVEPEDEHRLQPFTRWMRAEGRRTTGPEVYAALATFRGIGQMLADLFLATWDVVLTPSLAQPTPRLGAFSGPDPEAAFAAMTAFMPYTPLANIAGLPSISVPVGRTDDGLPIGALLTGRWGEESTVALAAAAVSDGRPVDRPAVGSPGRALTVG